MLYYLIKEQVVILTAILTALLRIKPTLLLIAITAPTIITPLTALVLHTANKDILTCSLILIALIIFRILLVGLSVS